MGYRVHWRLLGRENRTLDSGEIDGGFKDRQAALTAVGAFLQQFSLWGRNEEYGSWWAKRSADADILVQVLLVEDETPAPDPDRIPPVWVTQRSGASLKR